MSRIVAQFYELITQPLTAAGRLSLAAFVIPLAISLSLPLWTITMEAPQYPNGLELTIYAYKIEGGNDGQHLQEINTLNHYIGMRSLDREALSDLDWIPFALGGLLILTLRVALIGNLRSVIDLIVITAYVSVFAFARFVYTLYQFGHNLNPEAPVKVPGFMPAVIGSKQIANFTTHSWPSTGSLLLAVYALGIVAVFVAQCRPRHARTSGRSDERAPSRAPAHQVVPDTGAA
jgi:hypothetical protein